MVFGIIYQTNLNFIYNFMENYGIFSKVKLIHFVGIGGISMSALAKMVLNKGIAVSGSDIKRTSLIDELEKLGVSFYLGHSINNIKNANIVVYTSAVGENNVEVVEARKKNLLVLERADFLHYIALEYGNVIAVAGTHGKTTTCGMIASIFITGNLNPTVHIGGESSITTGNLKIGGKEYFISEACEYQRHMLKIPHSVGVILNIEYDHPDYYKNLCEVGDAFAEFSSQSTSKTIIDEKYKVYLLGKENKSAIETFSLNGTGDWTAKNIRQYKKGLITFDCFKRGEFFGNFAINCFGKYNVLNALCSIAVADHFKINSKDIWLGLKNFYGIKRRFQFMGKINNCPVIHDYAHHPTQLENVISTAREIFKKPVVCVFQPHTYSRTLKLFTEFVSSLANVDKLIIVPTYAAREKPIKNATAKSLFNALKFRYKNAVYEKNFESAYKLLKRVKNRVILILGAGDIVELAEKIKTEYLKKEKTNKQD